MLRITSQSVRIRRLAGNKLKVIRCVQDDLKQKRTVQSISTNNTTHLYNTTGGGHQSLPLNAFVDVDMLMSTLTGINSTAQVQSQNAILHSLLGKKATKLTA